MRSTAYHLSPSSAPSMADIEKPDRCDVLSGRGVSTNRHPGNIRFRSLVALNKELYVTSTKRQKMAISRSIVDAVRSMNPPGRFLEKNPETKFWSDIGDRKAIEKTSQALRDGASNLRKQLSSDLVDPKFLEEVFEDKGDEKAKGRPPTGVKTKPKSAKVTAKHGHRRTRSNPDSLVFSKHKKAHVRKRKPPEHPMSPSGTTRRLSHSNSNAHPLSPREHQVLASAHSFDGDYRTCHSHTASPVAEPYLRGECGYSPYRQGSPSFDGWRSPQSPRSRVQWFHRSMTIHEAYVVGAYPPPPPMNSPPYRQPSPSAFSQRSASDGWHPYGDGGEYWMQRSPPHYTPPRSYSESPDISVPELPKVGSRGVSTSASLSPRNSNNPYRDPRAIYAVSSAEDFLPPPGSTPRRSPTRPMKELTASPRAPTPEKSIKRAVASPSTASVTETESDTEGAEPIGEVYSEESLPHLPDEACKSNKTCSNKAPESDEMVQVKSEPAAPGSSDDGCPSDEESGLRSLSPLPFEKGVEDWMDMSADLFQLPMVSYSGEDLSQPA